MAHTPGPWIVIHESRAQSRWIVGDNEGGSIADCEPPGPWISRDEADANARLIAAAPEMLEALQALVAQILDYEKVNNLSPNPGRKYCWDNTERAVAAIAKATGNQT